MNSLVPDHFSPHGKKRRSFTEQAMAEGKTFLQNHFLVSNVGIIRIGSRIMNSGGIDDNYNQITRFCILPTGGGMDELADILPQVSNTPLGEHSLQIQ